MLLCEIFMHVSVNKFDSPRMTNIALDMSEDTSRGKLVPSLSVIDYHPLM